MVSFACSEVAQVSRASGAVFAFFASDVLVLQRFQFQLGKSNDFLSTAVNRTLFIEGADAKKKTLSIALQENALRVMCLSRGPPGSAPGEPGLLQRRPPHQPWEAPCRLPFGAPRRLIISAPRLSPEVSCAPLGPSSPAARLGAKNSQIQRLDPEKSPENHR